MTLAANKIWTDKELLALPKDGYDHEIINGEHYMSPSGANHSAVIGEIIMALGAFVPGKRLGKVLDGQAGCRMTSGDLFSPDVSFVSTKRWQQHKRKGDTFFQGSPDLVVEVLSPGDTIGAVEEKLRQYFENGSRLAWVVNPMTKTALVYHGPSADKLLTLKDGLDGEAVIPGFLLPLEQVFS